MSWRHHGYFPNRLRVSASQENRDRARRDHEQMERDRLLAERVEAAGRAPGEWTEEWGK